MSGAVAFYGLIILVSLQVILTVLLLRVEKDIQRLRRASRFRKRSDV